MIRLYILLAAAFLKTSTLVISLAAISKLISTSSREEPRGSWICCLWIIATTTSSGNWSKTSRDTYVPANFESSGKFTVIKIPCPP